MCACTHTHLCAHTNSQTALFYMSSQKYIYLYFNDYSFIEHKCKLEIILLLKTVSLEDISIKHN